MGGVHSAECRENMRKVSLETMGHGEEGMGEGSTRGGGGRAAEQGGSEAVVRAVASPVPLKRRLELREGLDPDFPSRET